MSLQTISNVENIESHAYTRAGAERRRMRRDVSRKEDKGERRARCIRAHSQGGVEIIPEERLRRCLWGSRFKLHQEDGGPCPLTPTIWTLCFTRSSSFPKARDTYVSESPPWQLKIKDTSVFLSLLWSNITKGEKSFSKDIAAEERPKETRMSSVVYLLGFFSRFLPTVTLIALIARGM